MQIFVTVKQNPYCRTTMKILFPPWFFRSHMASDFFQAGLATNSFCRISWTSAGPLMVWKFAPLGKIPKTDIGGLSLRFPLVLEKKTKMKFAVLSFKAYEDIYGLWLKNMGWHPGLSHPSNPAKFPSILIPSSSKAWTIYTLLQCYVLAVIKITTG